MGSAIAHRLLREGAREVVVFDLARELPGILQDEAFKNRLRVLTGDIRLSEDVNRAIAGADYVFHEAGLRVTQCARDPRLAHEVLVDGTFHVVSACAEYRVKKLVFASSAIVYGEPIRLPLDEDHPVHDTTLYGAFKIANENLMRSFRARGDVDFVALRYFNIYGPGMNITGSEVEVLIRWLDRMDQGLSPLIYGDGKQTLDYIFIDDVVEANIRALLAGEPGEVFNVCTGRETSILELLEILCRVRGVRVEPEFRESRPVNQVDRRFGSPDKACRDIGFRAQVDLREGLRRLVEWRDRILGSKATLGSTGLRDAPEGGT